MAKVDGRLRMRERGCLGGGGESKRGGEERRRDEERKREKKRKTRWRARGPP